MCMELYLASDERIPPSEESDGSTFGIQELTAEEEMIRWQFTKPEVRHLGVHGCSCGFLYDPDDPDAQSTLRALEELRALLTRLVRTHSEVELFYCWDGDQGREPDRRIETTAAEIGRESCPLSTSTFYRVRRS